MTIPYQGIKHLLSLIPFLLGRELIKNIHPIPLMFETAHPKLSLVIPRRSNT